MEVILIKDMENLGYANDIVNVKPGYANNYLIPQGIAKAATATAKKVLAENLRQRAHKDAKILADAQALAETIANLPLSLAVKAEEGKLFGTVTAADLAEALAAKGFKSDFNILFSTKKPLNFDKSETFVCTFSLITFSFSPLFPSWLNPPETSIFKNLLKIGAEVDIPASTFCAELLSLCSV